MSRILRALELLSHGLNRENTGDPCVGRCIMFCRLFKPPKVSQRRKAFLPAEEATIASLLGLIVEALSMA